MASLSVMAPPKAQSREVVLSTCYVLKMCEPRALAAYPLVKLLLIANSAVNPLAYAFLKTDIKREIKKFFECGFVSRFHPSVFSHGGDGQVIRSDLDCA